MVKQQSRSSLDDLVSVGPCLFLGVHGISSKGLLLLLLARAVPGTAQVTELLAGQDSMYQAMLGRFPENLCPYGVLWPGG